MKKSKHQALPLVLCGLTLTSLGAMPLLELGYALDVSQDKMQSLRALTVFDKSALALSVLSVAIGGALLFSLWLKLSDLYALRTVKVLAIALAVIAVADAALLMSVASERGLDTPWKTSIYADHERLFEQQINDVFCHAKGLQVCELGSMAEARQIFPLQSWPVDSDRTPGRRIASSCEGFQDNVPFWDYQSKMKLCSLCANVTFEEIALQRRFGTKYNAEVLAAVAVLSFEELQWCGEYLLALTRYDHDVRRSPYWKHRREFQKLLKSDAPYCTLVSIVKVLQLLEVVSGVCCLMLVCWSRILFQTGKLVQYRSGSKAEIV